MGWDGMTGDDAAKRAGVLILHASDVPADIHLS